MTGSGVVVGGSAGSHPALLSLVAGLPADLPAAVLVVIHVGDQAASRLPQILSRAGRLPAAHPSDGAPLRDGEIVVAPPGFYLLVEDKAVRLGRGPRVNRVRPAVDVLFGSAARAFGDQVTAVVLSGMLDDGAVGAALVSMAGGRCWSRLLARRRTAPCREPRWPPPPGRWRCQRNSCRRRRAGRFTGLPLSRSRR